ncbi:hypothetical protein [Paraglaciecola sp. L3A3]|uniref:hypothetical protein n=1 Tax=Paraglaciecola sp. L3A3 TaxID=2686358 RepID=UPI00131EBF6F|nr:hypothetical protein [Paraglaciecola sp. L3A3]
MKYIFLIGITWFLFSSPISAKEGEISYGIFGNVSAVTSSSEKLGYKAEIDSEREVFKDEIDFGQHSKLGAQIEYGLSDNIDFFGQILIRSEEKSSFDELLNTAFIRLKLNSTVSLRVGRTPFDLFLNTEIRDIGFAYTWAKLPQEVYGLIPSRNVDGIDLIYQKPLSFGFLRSKLSAGSSKYPVGNNNHLELKDFISFNLELSEFNWTIGLRYTETTIAGIVEAAAPLADWVQTLNGIWIDAEQVALGLRNELKPNYLSIGGKYDWEKFTIYTEFAKISSNGSAFFDKVNNGYISGIYRINDFEHFLSYAFTQSRRYKANIAQNLTVPIEQLPAIVTSSIPILENQLNNNFNSFTTNQQTISLGTRWNFSDNIAFKLQYDASFVDANGATLWKVNRESGDIDKDMTINTLLLDVSFAY